VIRLLLENGALCERDTFQGERCLYNALNDRIRNLLLSYDYAKSTNPLQPLAAHITTLLIRPTPKTTDITITAYDQDFHLHKFLLAARSPYFAKKLAAAPSTTTWKLPDTIPAESLGVALQYLYFQEVSVRRALYGDRTIVRGDYRGFRPAPATATEG
jgi:ankyrin repeat/BTB/POZ domain-containing protein 1